MNITNAVYISNQRVSIFLNQITIKRNNDLRTTCDFVVQDPTGLVRYSERQPVHVEDSVRGRRFSGYINKVTYTNQHPNPDTQIAISCVDESDLAQKAYSRRDYLSQDAGDIAADLHNNYLSGLGVTAKYAVRRDASAIQFGLGTLSNVIGANNVDDGDLELKNAGAEVTVTETSTADFASGTLTNVNASNNALNLNSVQALQMVGTSQQGANDNYTYLKIWSGSVTIATDDQFVYTIWVSSSSPKATGGLDLTMTDASNLRDGNIFDQNGLFVHPKTDLSGYGVDVWYTRNFGMNDYVGKTISYMTIAQEGDTNGQYTFYVRDAKILTSTGTLKAQLMTNGTPAQTPTQLSDLGYSGVSLKTVTGYVDSGNRISPARDISAAGIIRTSIVSWSLSLIDMYGNLTSIANNAQGANNEPYCTVESSIDGGVTWQVVNNHGSIQNLYAGASASGLSVLFRQTLCVAGPDPTIAPVLNDFTMSVEPSYLTTITNIQSKYSSANWGTSGSYSNTATSPVGDLALNGVYRNWLTDANPYANITLLSTGGATMNVVQPNSCLQIRCNAQTDVRARLDDAGNWSDCTIEVDVLLTDAIGNYGICYRGSGNNTNDTYAYSAFINSTSVTLGHGTNTGSGSGAFTAIQVVSVPLTTGQWYHLKVVATGSSHKVYVNDVLYVNVTDSTYTGSGTISLRHYNSNAVGGARHSGFFQNFGVIVNQTGTWVSTGVSLASLTIFGASLIQWNDTTPSNATLKIESSIDNGTSYQTCTNNAALPNATPGTSASGKTLKLRVTETAQNANVTPNLHGLSVLLSSAFSVSGNRISPALSLSSAETAGSASVQWNALVPANTSLNIDTSPDGSTWTLAGGGASGSVAIPGIVTQQDAIDDSFDSDTSANYTNTFGFGGSIGTWSWDTANSRLSVTGGSKAFLLYSGLSTADVDILTDMDQTDVGGLAWRVSSDHKNYYQLIINDGSSINTPNTIALFKSVGGTRSYLTEYDTYLRRGAYHRYRVTMIGAVITVYLDGKAVLTYTDGSPLAAGGAGLANDGGSAHFYQVRVQALGQIVTGQSLYTRARLTSSDPTATPQLEDLTLSVRSPDIITGALIPESKYSVLTGSTNTLFDDFLDLGKQSNAVATIDCEKALKFVSRQGTPSPWIITSDDMLTKTNITVQTNGDLYRNREILFGGTDTLARVESFVGDGITQTWPTSYKVQSVNNITVNGNPMTVGIQGVDSGKDFYYKPGETGFSQDASLTPLDNTQMPQIDYLGISTATVIMSDDDQINQLAALDNTDGVIEAAEDVSQQALGVEAMLQLAESRLTQYAILAHSFSFTTLRDGLMPNMVAPVFIDAYHIHDGQYVISSISENIDAVNVEYDVAMTDGPDVYDYQHYLVGR